MSAPEERRVVRGPNAKVGMTKREGDALKKKVQRLIDKVERLEDQLELAQTDMTEVQFVDALVLNMAAEGGKGLPKVYQSEAWLNHALETRERLFALLKTRKVAT